VSDGTYIFTLTVRSVPDLLTRVVHTFARRGCVIQNIEVEPSGAESATMTIVANNISSAEQISLQLEKLVDVKQSDFKQVTAPH
jgi:acetolactate synthase small subunit